MLPAAARAVVESLTPKINPDLGNGIAVTHMKEIEHYHDSVMRSVSSDFPAGLVYLGSRACDPAEMFAASSKAKSGKKTFDIAPSDVYLVEYRFQYLDEPPFSKYVYLPFVGEAGSIRLSGTNYVISPVLADRVFSVGNDFVFTRLLKAMPTFKRLPQAYIANNLRENHSVIYSKIHNNKTRSTGAAVKAESTIIHYLLCKYGFTQMFEKFVGFAPRVISAEEALLYKSEDWVICRSLEKRPSGVRNPKGDAGYLPSPIHLAIPKDRYTDDVKNLVAGFLYVVCHFPQRANPAFLEDPRMWKQLLGHVLWPGSDYSEGQLYHKVENHFISLDSYLDVITAKKLAQIDMHCKDIYELFYMVVKNFARWSIESADKINSMYGKELSVLTFVCRDFVTGINNAVFKLTPIQKKLTSAEISEIIGKNLKLKGVFNLPKTHGECSTTGTSGDNKAFRVTNILVPQSKSTRREKAAQVRLDDPTIQLHSSIMEVGGYACLPKSGPDGRERLNLYLKIDPTGLVQRDPKHREYLDNIQEKIRIR